MVYMALKGFVHEDLGGGITLYKASGLSFQQSECSTVIPGATELEFFRLSLVYIWMMYGVKLFSCLRYSH